MLFIGFNGFLGTSSVRHLTPEACEYLAKLFTDIPQQLGQAFSATCHQHMFNQSMPGTCVGYSEPMIAVHSCAVALIR